jgi:superfamily I DNA and/or RNA helicase
VETLEAINNFAREYNCLKRVLTEDGYISVIDNILRGNTAYVKHVYEALDNYIASRDINKLLGSLDENKLSVLNFAYTSCKNYANYLDIINKLLEIRIYHEVIRYEEECKDDLATLVDYHNITAKIYKLKEQQLSVAYELCAGKNSRVYDELYESSKDNKDYLYQISKKSKYWPIRKTMEVYSKFILTLFPCWLLSPENVSNLLPLTKNLFDVVIFDEASQVFIESTIPTIYRGKSIVVAGDDKQLRPSATFMKRYLGADPDTIDDYSVQAALEVDSLLDLAVSRYESSNLTYHYRSKHQELIDFSNYAFYNGNLQVSPNISKNRYSRPIERYKVRGRWIDRKNTEEAKQIVEILKNIFATRKNNESIGIITFNSDQQSHIADIIDKAAAKDPAFRSDILKETHRIENGEDTSLFIKNLENVQGDERDIIIFSIGYAPNEAGKLYTNFGSLSQEGGENRLNVAITRAKSKIVIVTSIEPEELKVDNSKNIGPRLLQKYLMFTRAVSRAEDEEAAVILSELRTPEAKPEAMFTNVAAVEVQMKERLEKLGYQVDTGLGNENNRISLAIYDKESDRYLVGVELDTDAFKESSSCLERDVYKPRFLEARGWTLVRVWCRDWWLYPNKVIKNITTLAEKNKKK